MKFINDFIIKNTQKDKERIAREDMEHWENFAFPENVEELRDIPYIDDGQAVHLMDIYRPREHSEPLPVILDIHGGGLMFASKLTNRDFCATMAAKGFLVFCPEYPLIPDVNAFDQIATVIKAMNAVDAVLESYGGDRERVYMAGDSAGGYLVTYANVISRSEDVARAAGIEGSALKVRALGLIGGMFYTRKVDKNALFLMNELMYGKKYKRHPFAPFMNPEHPSVCGKLPPCILVTANGDFLQEYSRCFAKALEKQNREYKLFDLDAELFHVYNVLDTVREESVQANNAIAEFFMEH